MQKTTYLKKGLRKKNYVFKENDNFTRGEMFLW